MRRRFSRARVMTVRRSSGTKGLERKWKAPALHGLHRRGDGAVAGDDHDFAVVVQGLDFFQGFQAVQVGHDQVQENRRQRNCAPAGPTPGGRWWPPPPGSPGGPGSGGRRPAWSCRRPPPGSGPGGCFRMQLPLAYNLLLLHEILVYCKGLPRRLSRERLRSERRIAKAGRSGEGTIFF